MSFSTPRLAAASLLSTLALSLPHNGRTTDTLSINIPSSGAGASIKHSPSFSSFSFEPAFWYEFFGNATILNDFTFTALSTLWEHGGQPHIRPGGISMDSMVFNASAGDPVRTTNEDGGVYRTTFGPAYYQSWDNFPEGTKFTSTLNFGNDSLDIARDMAVASVHHQADKIDYFELGNEPNTYDSERWDNSTAAYVKQWKIWVTAIDRAVNRALGGAEKANSLFSHDTFANALWTVDSELIYAVRNVSACISTRAPRWSSRAAANSAGDDGSPGFSTYDFLYPRPSSKRGDQRTLPTFVGLLFLAEALAQVGTQVRGLSVPEEVGDYFSAYAFYNDGCLSKIALLNMRPYYGSTTDDYSVSFDVGWKGQAKRMTAPVVDEKDSGLVTWGGQSFESGSAEGEAQTEEVDGAVRVRGSEAVLVSFGGNESHSSLKGKA